MALAGGGLPMVSQLRAQIEAIMLVVDSPVHVTHLAKALSAQEDEVTSILRSWADECVERGSGFDVRETQEGWRLYTSPACADVVEAFLLGGMQTKLSRAAMETLAVVAYRQPVTRAQVAGVRGVNVDGVMRTLTMRGLISEVSPDESTGAHRYITTDLFLELLGIDALDQLPSLAPLLPEVETIEEEW